MVSQDKLIRAGIQYTDTIFLELEKRLLQGIRQSDTLEEFLKNTSEYTISNPLVTLGFDAQLLGLILRETNNHRFSRPAQKELTRLTIENYVGDLITNVGEDIKNSVRDIVKDGYNNGLTQAEIADNISTSINQIKNTRARTIARTEIARTAVISDYIISNERGATHFKVDCRGTCCPICEHDYHWGDKIYPISETSMLPPRHPNCRCVPFFFREGTDPGALKNKRLLEKEIQELEDTKTIQSDPNLTIAEKRNKLKEMGYGKGNYDVKNIDERIKRFKSELK